MPPREVAFLGPIGTYSHLVMEKRYGRRCKLVPLPTILDICSFVSRKPTRRGIVPIENSSGGAIYETVDILLANKPRFCIEEELSLKVRLALLGRKGDKIKVLYSHFAPLEHCATWLRRRLPRVDRRVVGSTAAAAYRAASETHAAALGSKKLASLCHLDVLHYPVEADIVNITTFLAIGGKRRVQPKATKTSLAVLLPNKPGGLCTFLESFRSERVNLSRIISRPVRGCPKEYAFLVDVEGSTTEANVKRALRMARDVSVQVRGIGSYPTRRTYQS